MIAALLDHLWQSTVFAFAAGLLTLMLRNNGAHMRYWVWLAASLKFLVPFAPLVRLGITLVSCSTAPAVPMMWSEVTEQFATPFAGATPVLTPQVAAEPSVSALLLVVWAAGSLAILAIWIWRWMRIATICRAAPPLALQAPMAVKAVPSLLEPGLFGLLRPSLLLPQGFLTRLSQAEIKAVLAHEICHYQRRDNLTAALHMLVEVVFWFHPLVWWLGARLIDERERACDEAVVASGNDAETYAESVLKVCRLYLHAPLACTAGVSGADLKRRVEAIMSAHVVLGLAPAKRFVLASFAAATLIVPVAAGFLSAPLAASLSLAGQSLVDERLAEQARSRSPIAFDVAEFSKFEGYYEVRPYAFAHVFRTGNHFMAQLTGQVPLEIFPESAAKFFMKIVPAQISFTRDPLGTVTGLVLHQNGFEQAANKVPDAVARRLEAALAARVRAGVPSPGTEQSLRRYIAALEAGSPNYGEMTPSLAAAVHRLAPVVLATIRQVGAFRSLTFKGVAADGWDVFEAHFDHGNIEWRCAPLVDGKADNRIMRSVP